MDIAKGGPAVHAAGSNGKNPDCLSILVDPPESLREAVP